MVVEDCQVLGDMTMMTWLLSLYIHHYCCRRLPGTWRHDIWHGYFHCTFNIMVVEDCQVLGDMTNDDMVIFIVGSSLWMSKTARYLAT